MRPVAACCGLPFPRRYQRRSLPGDPLGSAFLAETGPPHRQGSFPFLPRHGPPMAPLPNEMARSHACSRAKRLTIVRDVLAISRPIDDHVHRRSPQAITRMSVRPDTPGSRSRDRLASAAIGAGLDSRRLPCRRERLGGPCRDRCPLGEDCRPPHRPGRIPGRQAMAYFVAQPRPRRGRLAPLYRPAPAVARAAGSGQHRLRLASMPTPAKLGTVSMAAW